MTDGENHVVMKLVSSLSRELGEAQGDIWLMAYFLDKAAAYMTNKQGGAELKAEIFDYLDRRDARAALKRDSDDLDDAVLKNLDKHGPVYAAIENTWGPRCSDYEPECVCCQAWKEFDEGKSASGAKV